MIEYWLLSTVRLVCFLISWDKNCHGRHRCNKNYSHNFFSSHQADGFGVVAYMPLIQMPSQRYCP